MDIRIQRYVPVQGISNVGRIGSSGGADGLQQPVPPVHPVTPRSGGQQAQATQSTAALNLPESTGTYTRTAAVMHSAAPAGSTINLVV